MFRSKTLFIIGAGASKEADLPTGFELKKLISHSVDIKFKNGQDKTSGDDLITEALRLITRDKQTGRSGDINPYLRAGSAIRDAMHQSLSIDDFIDAHNDNKEIELVGKLAIARCILESERKSFLYYDQTKSENIDFSRTENTWFPALFQMASENVSKLNAQASMENLQFITFNYDRSLEFYLVKSFVNYYKMSEIEAQKIVSEVAILHPYGQAGSLPWQDGTPKIAFGGNGTARADELVAVSKGIKTFTERFENDEFLNSIRKCVRDAETIVFSGFAFHPQNLELIAPDSLANARRIFGTAKGMSTYDASAISADLPTWLKCKPQHVEVLISKDLTAAGLFREFWRSMPRAIN